MNHYVLNLEGYPENKIDRIILNIRFWCLDFKQRGENAIYDITSSYDLTPEFLASKGISDTSSTSQTDCTAGS